MAKENVDKMNKKEKKTEKVEKKKVISKAKEKLGNSKPIKAKKDNYSIRGNVFEGIVTSAKATKTVKVERTLTKFVKKYERYKKAKSIVYAHNPEEINAKEGDFVRVGETRPISKTKNFVVMDILKKAE